ncbi:MAG: hypothetical protein V3U71_08570 [Cocleimonas sp.]
MKLKKIKFKTNKDKVYIPNKITAELTLEEAIWIGKKAGEQTGQSIGTIYECLIGDVFNTYWEDGIDDAQRELNGN